MTDHDRDAHLLAALRHAPDRDAAPPPALSEAILRQAQAAVRRPAARSEPARGRVAVLGAWFDKLLRPAPAAAFGTLAVAGIVGLMWATQEPPGVADEPAGVGMPVNAQQAEPVAASAQSAPAAAPAAAATGATDAPMANKPPAPAAAAAKAAPSKPKAAVPPAAAPAAPQYASRSAEPTEVADHSTRIEAAPALSAQRAPATMQAAEQVAGASHSAAPTAARPDAAQALARSAAAPAMKSSGTEAARLSAAQQRSMAEAGALALTGPGGGSPLASVLAQLNAAGGSAQWTSPQGKTITHGAVQQQWLADLSRGTADAWRRVPDGMAPPSGGASWSLRHQGGLIGSLWIEGATLWWRDARGLLFAASAPQEQVRGWIEAAKNW